MGKLKKRIRPSGSHYDPPAKEHLSSQVLLKPNLAGLDISQCLLDNSPFGTVGIAQLPHVLVLKGLEIDLGHYPSKQLNSTASFQLSLSFESYPTRGVPQHFSC